MCGFTGENFHLERNNILWFHITSHEYQPTNNICVLKDGEYFLEMRHSHTQKSKEINSTALQWKKDGEGEENQYHEEQEIEKGK